MLNRHESVFWTNYNEYSKTTQNPIFKKISSDLKTKINEIFHVSYYGIFQYQLSKGISLSSIAPAKILEITEYISKNYSLLFQFAYQSKEVKSKFLDMTQDDKQFIFEAIDKIVIPYIAENDFKNVYNFLKKNSAPYTLLMNLAFKHEFDVNYINENDSNRIYHGIAYPVLVTMLMIDVTEPSKMMEKITKIYSIENISKALKSGRSLSKEEIEYIKSDIDTLNCEEDFHSLILNFSYEKWNETDLNTRYRLVFQLSKYTALFLKDNMKKISVLRDGEEIFELIHNYLPILMLKVYDLNLDNTVNEFETEEGISDFLMTYNCRDFDVEKTLNHIKSMKNSNKITITEDKLKTFVRLSKYSTSYLELVHKLKRGNGILGNYLIENKKIGIVNTLKFYVEDEDKKYVLNYKNVRFNFIKLDSKDLERLETPANKFVELANDKSEINIMLRIISLILTIEPKSAKMFGYSWENMVKYYLVAFGPYKKSKHVYDRSDLKLIENKVNKLLTQYKTLKQKEKVIDSLYLISKLSSFKN
ncbi:hypothetical protein [Mesoplasma photuris]|uniref:hypothetical protein n=1 Tax=Mesoplasma photuris TaxID=217731 RepID=UPI0004E0DD6E|nr:hypothetical protein [Mesoplasma photuris]